MCLASHLLYDLHSHTNVSDGMLTPQALVTRAVEKGVDVLAITDHDTLDAIAAARLAITEQQLPLRLISGVEVSTCWLNHEIHIVGLAVDIDMPDFTCFLNAQQQRRFLRAAMIAQRLEKAHISGVLEGVRQMTDGFAITRGHIARFLISQGKAETMAQVFKKYLARGKTGYVPPQWCSMEQAISAIHGAGGYAVLAHPARYGLSAKWLRRLLVSFSENGGDAMEVAQCQQSPHERSQLARYAQDYHLLASLGSDFHEPCPWIELGRKMWLPGGVEALWQRYPQMVLSAFTADRGEAL